MCGCFLRAGVLIGHVHPSHFCEKGWVDRALLFPAIKYFSTTNQKIGDLYCPVDILIFLKGVLHVWL
jgi:hypothetical protein